MNDQPSPYLSFVIGKMRMMALIGLLCVLGVLLHVKHLGECWHLVYAVHHVNVYYCFLAMWPYISLNLNLSFAASETGMIMPAPQCGCKNSGVCVCVPVCVCARAHTYV